MPTYNLLSAPLKEIQQMVYDAYIKTTWEESPTELLRKIYLAVNGKEDPEGELVPPSELKANKR